MAVSRVRRSLIGLLAVALSVAACGADDDTADGAPTLATDLLAAVAAVEEELGAGQDYFEVTAATLNQLTRDRGRSEADMQEDLKNAWNAYCESLGEAGQPNASGFVSYLGEQDLKDSLSDLQVLHQLLRDIELLGLTRREQVGDSFSPKRWIITKIMPGAIVADDPEMVLADQIIAEAAQQPLATMEQAGQQPPPAPF